MRARVIVLTALVVITSVLDARAQVPQPVAVPMDLPEATRSDLLHRRDELLQRRETLRAAVAAHNRKCTSVPEGSAAAAACAQAQAELREAIVRYGAAVKDFNEAVNAATAVAGPRRAFTAISVDEERALGRQCIRELDASGLVVTDPLATTYVTNLASRLAAQIRLDTPITLRVVRDAEVNAFTLPGGVIVVNTGLLGAVQSDSELAAVLAHELGHSSRRHPVQATETLANSLGLAAALGGPVTALAAPLIRATASYKFQRDQEREADRLAVETLYRAGIKPTGMIRLFDRWRRTEGNASAIDQLFLTHPTSEERLRNISALLADPRFNPLPEASPSSEFRGMQRRVVAP